MKLGRGEVDYSKGLKILFKRHTEAFNIIKTLNIRVKIIANIYLLPTRYRYNSMSEVLLSLVRRGGKTKHRKVVTCPR